MARHKTRTLNELIEDVLKHNNYKLEKHWKVTKIEKNLNVYHVTCKTYDGIEDVTEVTQETIFKYLDSVIENQQINLKNA